MDSTAIITLANVILVYAIGICLGILLGIAITRDYYKGKNKDE